MKIPFDNFCLVMPTDIMRHPDGTAMTGFKSDEEKEACRLWIIANEISDEQFRAMTGKEKEELFTKFRNQNNEQRAD